MENLKNKKGTTRVILNLANEIDGAFADLAHKRGITKTSMIVYSMSWFLDYNKSLEFMPKLIDALNKLPTELQ